MDMETGTGHGVRDIDGPVSILRCRQCEDPVRLEGNPLVPPQLRKAVHAETGRETGADGHLAAPVGAGPAVAP